MMLILAALQGCAATTGFSSTPEENEGVQGNAVLALSDDALVILDAQVGYSRDGSLTATSAGDGNLLVYEVALLDNTEQIFYFEEPESTLTVAPGQALTWRVVATLEREEPAFATLRVRTNDPAANDLRVPVSVYPSGQEPPEDSGAGPADDTGDSGGASAR
jgi:hypothetical protein